MMQTFCKINRLSVLLVTAVLVCVGCGTPKPKNQPWSLNLTKVTPASIEVDLIGVSQLEKAAWEGYPLDNYWAPGDLRRRNADKLTSNFQSGNTWSVPQTDPKWKGWLGRGASELLIIANLPGSFPSGPADPRRIFLPLDKKAWEAKGQTLEIQIQDTLINVMTPPKVRN
jgi:hypothetical protein